MTGEALVVWNELNQRQQTYLRLIYKADQSAEETEAAKWKLGHRRRPAEEWRWLLYADLASGPSYLKSLLLIAKLIDPGTGATFKALEDRKLIQCRHEFDIDAVWVKLTTHGRKVARTGLGEQAPKKLPTGTLREWHWKALVKVYEATALFGDGIPGRYGDISWNTWLRLRDYKSGALVKETGKWQNGKYIYGVQITDFGERFYEENWTRYRELYPEVNAPAPRGKS